MILSVHVRTSEVPVKPAILDSDSILRSLKPSTKRQQPAHKQRNHSSSGSSTANGNQRTAAIATQSRTQIIIIYYVCLHPPPPPATPVCSSYRAADSMPRLQLVATAAGAQAAAAEGPQFALSTANKRNNETTKQLALLSIILVIAQLGCIPDTVGGSSRREVAWRRGQRRAATTEASAGRVHVPSQHIVGPAYHIPRRSVLVSQELSGILPRTWQLIIEGRPRPSARV